MKLVISASPHIDSGATTRKIMGDVLIALCPALIAAVIIFGWRALLVTAVCAAACVFFEWGFEKLCHKPSTIDDLSAVVTGVILAYNLPVSIPLWQAVFGCLVAIVAVKQLFGGIGKNFANPALVGRIVLFLSFSKTMTAWVFPDAVSSATRWRSWPPGRSRSSGPCCSATTAAASARPARWRCCSAGRICSSAASSRGRRPCASSGPCSSSP